MAKHKRKRKKRSHYNTGTYVSTKTGQHCKYRSGWELAYMTWLDTEPTVATFGYETVIVPYISNVKSSRIRKYWPDFLVTYVDGRVELIEIKPSKRMMQSNVQKKLAAAEVWCQENGATLRVLTEHELKSMGLMKRGLASVVQST